MSSVRYYDPDGQPRPCDEEPSGPYLYQWVHVLDGRPLHLNAHLDLLHTASQALFHQDFPCDAAVVAQRIEALLRANRYPREGSSFIRLRHYASTGRLTLLPGGISLYAGYALRSLRPVGTVLPCTVPCDEFPTSAREAVAMLVRRLAQSAGAQVALRSDSDGIVSDADDAPLFAVRGTEIITPPGPAGVEGQIMRDAISAAGFTLREEPITRETLRRSDEVFYFDHRGVTSLISCDGTSYMDLTAGRIAQELASPF